MKFLGNDKHLLLQVDLDSNIDLNAEAKLNGAEILQLSEDMINPKRTKLGPQDFELKKVLGRGGYGKVFQVSVSG